MKVEEKFSSIVRAYLLRSRYRTRLSGLSATADGGSELLLAGPLLLD